MKGQSLAVNSVPPTSVRAPECPGDVVASRVQEGPIKEALAQADVLRDALTECYDEIRYRLSNKPFNCEYVACGQRSKNGGFDILAGRISPEIQKREGTLKEALSLGTAVSFEWTAPGGEERKTLGLLPIGDSTLILAKADRPRPGVSDYGLDTYFFHQARLAVGEVLTDQLGKQWSMRTTNGPDDDTAEAMSAAFEREVTAFERMLPDLLRSRKGWFVAIREGKIIDQDEDEFALARRVDRQFKSEFILVRQVSDEAEMAVLDSPECEMP